MKILPHTLLKPFHTFGLDVKAKKIIEAYDVKDFVQIWHQYSTEPKLVIGEGSNILFCDDFNGVVILNCLKGIDIKETATSWLLHVASGENWHELVCCTVEKNIAGLENLALIPGLVGAAPIQNIGAYGVEFKQYCEYVEVLLPETGELVRLSFSECEFSYRDSIFKHEFKDKAIIVAIGLALPKSWQPEISYGALQELKNDPDLTAKKIFNKVCEIRRSKLPDPSITGNAGSFFKNPVVSKSVADKLRLIDPSMPYYEQDSQSVKLAAGWLIEKAGLKGHTVGGAAVHDKQALVLINHNLATTSDVIMLAKQVVDTVYQQFSVQLEHEVRFINQTHETTLAALCLI